MGMRFLTAGAVRNDKAAALRALGALRALMPPRKEVKAPEGLLILSGGATTGDGEMDENPMRLNREGGLGDNYKNYGKDIRV